MSVLCHKVWFGSNLIRSSVCLNWMTVPLQFDLYSPDTPVFSLWLTVLSDLVFQALNQINGFHEFYRNFCFLWHGKSDTLIPASDNALFKSWSVLLLQSLQCFRCKPCSIFFQFVPNLGHPDSNRTWLQIPLEILFFLLIIRRTYGCNMLTIPFSTRCTLFWYMYCCYSYNLYIVINVDISLEVST